MDYTADQNMRVHCPPVDCLGPFPSHAAKVHYVGKKKCHSTSQVICCKACLIMNN